MRAPKKLLLGATLVLAVAARCATHDPLSGPRAFRELSMPAGMSWNFRVAFAGDIDVDGCDDLVWGSDVPGILAGVSSGRTGELLYVIEQDGAERGRKPRVAAAGRFDDDFRPDLLISLPYHRDGRGLVRVYKGGGSEVLFELEGQRPQEWLGRSLDAAQIDGDRVPELLLGRDAGALLLSGADGRVLAELEPDDADPDFGIAVRFVEDLDGDDVPELAIAGGEHPETGRRKLWLYSGADRRPLGRLEENVIEPRDLAAMLAAACGRPEERLPSVDDGPAWVEALGRRVEVSPWCRPLGDFDGDGVDDRLVRTSVREQVWVTLMDDETIYARVLVVSGATGRTLFDLPATFPLPMVVAGGDADGDGNGDLLVDGRIYSWPECR